MALHSTIHMPRKRTILQSQFPYHIRARCINKEWFRIPIEEVWNIMTYYLYFVHHAYNFQIHSFVLMSNHYHALVSTPQANLDIGMNYFQREVSRCLTIQSGRINQTFGGPYEWSVINSDNYFHNAYKYVYRNPVRAGIVRSCEEYAFSTLRGLLGFSQLIVPVIADYILFTPDLNENTLKWLNQANPDDEAEVKRALRKPQFEFPIIPGNGKPTRDPVFIY